MARTYRVGVIGRTGRGDYGHGIDVACLETPSLQVVAVADDDKQGLAKAAQRLKVDRAFNDYRQMLEAVRPEIVAIGPRWIDCHHEMVMAALESGAHVYMEKPFCRSLTEADEIVDLSQRKHLKLAIATQTRYSPKLAVIDKLIAEGTLGRILEFRGRGKEDARGGAEDLWVLGTHILDLTRRFGGNPQWCLASVEQDGQPISKPSVQPGPEGIGPLAGDLVRAMYGLPDGVTAYFNSRRNAGGKASKFGLQILGTAGVIELQTGYLPSVKFLPDPAWSPGRTGAKWVDVSTAGIDQKEPLSDSGLHGGNLAALADLVEAIEQDREPLASAHEARATTEMIAAVFASAGSGRRVDFPLQERRNPLELLS